MKRFVGGTKVRGGYYWNVAKWDIVAVQGNEGMLEGTREDRYVKLALPIMLVVAVTLSLTYAMFLPFIGFAMVGQFMARKALGAGGRLVKAAASSTAVPAGQLGAAYLAGKPGEKKEEEKKEAAPAPDALEKLEQEIAEERKSQADKNA